MSIPSTATGNQLHGCLMRELMSLEWLTMREFVFFAVGLVGGTGSVGTLWWWREHVRWKRRHYRSTGGW